MNQDFKHELYSQFFNNLRELKKGNAVSIYGTHEDNIEAIINQTVDYEHTVVKLSSIGQSEFEKSKPVFILQDLDFENFLDKVKVLVDKFIYPAWFYKQAIFFISPLAKDAYKVGNIDSKLVHIDLKMVTNLLVLEQMNNLLQMVNKNIISENHKLIEIKSDAYAKKEKHPFSKVKNEIPLEELNEEQRKAVMHLKGPMRVLAPAGSGKTKTLVNRVVNLINQGINQEEILALAFNKKAQKEMATRLQSKFNIQDVNISTFHSFGNQIINQTLGWNFEAHQEILGTRQLLDRALKSANHSMTLKRNTDPLDFYVDILSRSKNELYSRQEMKIEQEDGKFDFMPIFQAYILNTAKHRFYNYDDMIYLALRRLLSDSKMRAKIQKRYKYILVDEFQDLNKAQLLFLNIVSLPENNIFVCGDDDQMIYSFRGAEVDNILTFNKDQTISKDQVLELNYRSSKNIVDQSKWLIDHNKNRVYKNIRSIKESSGSIELSIQDSLKAQAVSIVEWIKRIKKEDYNYSDFTILYRYNEYRDLLFMILRKHHIPVRDQGINILNSSVGRSIMAYLTILYDKEQSNQDHFIEILKKTNKYLTNEFIATVRSWDDFIDTRRGHSYLNHQSYENYLDFVDKMKSFEMDNKSAAQIINSIISTFEFKEHYESVDRNSSDQETAKDMDVLEIIVGFASIFDSIDEFYNFFLNSKRKPNPHFKEIDGVHLSTVHKTKGNEYKNVAYYNLNSAPTKEISQKDYEEERRIVYVGITRAENNLLITTDKSDLSPFIKEIFLNPKYRHLNVRSLKIKIRDLQEKTKNLDYSTEEFQALEKEASLLKKELEYKQIILKSMSKEKNRGFLAIKESKKHVVIIFVIK